MVCFAFVACLDPAKSRGIVTAISRNSGFLFSKGKHCLEFREIAAAITRLCAGSKHATKAKQTIYQKLQNLADSAKKELAC